MSERGLPHRMKRRKTARGRSGSRSLASAAGFQEFVLDQLSELGDVRARAMFGGLGLYCGDCFFGIIARDALFLKVDDGNRADFEREGMKPFTPYADRAGTMQYYEVPVGVLESAPDLVRWARKSVATAERAAANRPVRTAEGERTPVSGPRRGAMPTLGARRHQSDSSRSKNDR